VISLFRISTERHFPHQWLIISSLISLETCTPNCDGSWGTRMTVLVDDPVFRLRPTLFFESTRVSVLTVWRRGFGLTSRGSGNWRRIQRSLSIVGPST